MDTKLLRSRDLLRRVSVFLFPSLVPESSQSLQSCLRRTSSRFTTRKDSNRLACLSQSNGSHKVIGASSLQGALDW